MLIMNNSVFGRLSPAKDGVANLMVKDLESQPCSFLTIFVRINSGDSPSATVSLI